jgi:hypothetical protein
LWKKPDFSPENVFFKGEGFYHSNLLGIFNINKSHFTLSSNFTESCEAQESLTIFALPSPFLSPCKWAEVRSCIPKAPACACPRADRSAFFRFETLAIEIKSAQFMLIFCSKLRKQDQDKFSDTVFIGTVTD